MKKIFTLIVFLAAGFFIAEGIDNARAANWIHCANENQTCSFTGKTRQVRFGDSNGPYNYLWGENSLPCNLATFGDPEPGVSKQCSYNDDVFENPLGENEDISALLTQIMGALTVLAIPVLAIMILWGAFQIMTSEGQEEKYRKGKKIIIYAVIGFVVIALGGGIGYIIRDVLVQ